MNSTPQTPATPRPQHPGGNRRPQHQQPRRFFNQSRPSTATNQPRPSTGTPPIQAVTYDSNQPQRQPTVGRGKLRLIPIGGMEEIGRNMHVIQYEDDILIIDMGLQFAEDDMPGIDYIIPNIGYLKGKEKQIRGVIITHGHMDHIGAIPHLIGPLGNPTLYGTAMTVSMIKRRVHDVHPEHQLKTQVITASDVLQLGKMRVEFVHVNHSIPGCLMVAVKTPAGTILNTGDWKFDFTPVEEKPSDFATLARLGDEGITVLQSDSTGAGKPGWQLSERSIGKTLEEVIGKSEGRLIIGTFASLLARVKQIIEISESLGKKVAIDGYSMKLNVEIGKEMGYIKCKQSTLVDMGNVENYPDDQIVIICTGAQGEGNAVLSRIANGEHKHIDIRLGDTVVFSSSIIAGNERAIQKLRDLFYKRGAKIINYHMMDVHAGGHCQQDEIKLLLNLVRPKYYMPVHGSFSFRHANADLAKEQGYDDSKILMCMNGQVVEGQNGLCKVTNEIVPNDYVFVDGLGITDSSDVVLRDRTQMSEEGMFVVIATVDGKTGESIGNPDIISRGFVYLKENKKLIEMARQRIKKILKEGSPDGQATDAFLKSKIRNDMGKFLQQKTNKRPLIIPVIIEV